MPLQRERKNCEKRSAPIRVCVPRHSVGALRGTRTPDPLLRRQMLYPAELSARTVLTANDIISY